MFESRGGGGRLAGVLAGLSPAARAAFLVELAECGAGPEEVEGWLGGQVPSTEELVLAELRAQDAVRARVCPVGPGELHAQLSVDEEGLSGLPEGWTDDKVIGWVRRAVALEAHVQWLRSVGVAALQARWSPPDTDTLVAGRADPGRRGRMRVRQRRHQRIVPGRTDRVDAEVLAESLVGAEIGLACGVSERTARGWVRAGSSLVVDLLPQVGQALCAGRLDDPAGTFAKQLGSAEKITAIETN